MATILGKLAFVPFERKFKVHKIKNLKKVSNKLYCVCVLNENKEFEAHINLANNTNYPDIFSLPFTEESKNLKGKEKVFTINPDKQGKYTCIIRDKTQAVLSPVNPDIYTPFRKDYVYLGYIVEQDGKKQFDIRDCIGHLKTYQWIIDEQSLGK